MANFHPRSLLYIENEHKKLTQHFSQVFKLTVTRSLQVIDSNISFNNSRCIYHVIATCVILMSCIMALVATCVILTACIMALPLA